MKSGKFAIAENYEETKKIDIIQDRVFCVYYGHRLKVRRYRRNDIENK